MKSTHVTIIHAIISIIALSFSTHAFAQNKGETLFKDKKAGISFNVPVGWTASPIIGGYLLQADRHGGYAFILPQAVDESELMFSSLRSAFLKESYGVELKPVSDTYTSTNGYEMIKMQGEIGWKKANAHACIVQTNTMGGFIIVAGKSGSANHYYEMLVETIADNLKVNSDSFELLVTHFQLQEASLNYQAFLNPQKRSKKYNVLW